MRQANILLDSELRCKITDFGLSRHVEATVTRTVAAHAINYTAPELFGMCKKCLRLNCIGCNERNATKTMEADVFAVGCLYYAVSIFVYSLSGHLMVVGAAIFRHRAF